MASKFEINFLKNRVKRYAIAFHDTIAKIITRISLIIAHKYVMYERNNFTTESITLVFAAMLRVLERS